MKYTQCICKYIIPNLKQSVLFFVRTTVLHALYNLSVDHGSWEFSFCIKQKQSTNAYLYWALKYISDVYFPSYFSTFFFYICFIHTLYTARVFACVTTIFLICYMLRNVLIFISNFAHDDIDLSQGLKICIYTSFLNNK